MKKQVVSGISLLLVFNLEAQAFDFGKVGTSFEVKEEGFVAMMMRKLKAVDFEAEKEKMTKIAKERVESPSPIIGINPATESREFWHDPSFILPKDVSLPCGKVLYVAGTTVNPLDHMDLERRLFFIDGREEGQIEWLKEQLQEGKDGNLEKQVILIAGSVFRLQEELGKEVYFDQSGEITSKWGIKASPAIAEQDGKMIRIREVELKKKEANKNGGAY